MASRILTCFQCTLPCSIVSTLVVIGLTSAVIGFVGLGLYIPTYINYNAYSENICFILNYEYNECQQENTDSQNTCYSIKWSVEYIISDPVSDRYIFSTITEAYDTSMKALERLKNHRDKTDQTCYYHTVIIGNVQWDKPTSYSPYFIMMIVGFSLTGVYFMVIGILTACPCRIPTNDWA